MQSEIVNTISFLYVIKLNSSNYWGGGGGQAPLLNYWGEGGAVPPLVPTPLSSTIATAAGIFVYCV